MPSQAGRLRRLVSGKRTVVAPGVFSPAVAKLAEKSGFEAIYFSGAGFSNLLALPDLGITTLSEVAQASRQITSRVSVPLIVDADTGFGEALNVARTVEEMVAAGVAAIHIEDQVLPKRCGHLDGKELVDADEMVKKLVSAKEAAGGRLMVIARTDARSVEGMEGAVERAAAYADAGADMIFPEALESRDEFKEMRQKVRVPLMANMTEFGKTPYLSAAEFQAMGYNMVIFPVTAFRAAMKAVKVAFMGLMESGTQKGMLDSLMSRQEFYDLIDYYRFEAADERAMKAAKELMERRR
ncbi:MAG: methylisocitrate lyase [Nitrososphaerota archaeon]|jgi:methylisocitrate lyase|nr:methylisocitrate lyase [Nitrososphaerota archaeon]MDG6946467.1 methylisocitrate lyase [Nitrososphaerota archaeon]MDG6947781.1 methylisocitrate lyase [Nitrososphaerota archaeon]